MDRRSLLIAMAAAGVTPASALAAPQSLREAARLAWIYGLPLLEMARSRDETLARGTKVNTLFAARELTTVETQSVTTPNNDTLYARAWFDLSAGPAQITLPPSGERYLSVALMDMYSNNFAVLGTRTTGGEGGTFTLVGPGAATPVRADVIRSPTRWVWMLARTLVAGPEDLAAANQAQDGIRVRAPAAPTPKPAALRSAEWPVYFGAVDALMRENPPPVTDAGLLAAISPLGLMAGRSFDAGRFSAAEASEIAAGVKEARASLAGRQGQVVDGWIYPKATLGDFGQDYVYRAQVSLGGLAALPPQEAMYMRARAADGGLRFDSARRYRLHLPADRLPPVNGFWSATIYEVTPDGQYFFTRNEIDRYALGDRSPGLRRNADGSLDLFVSRERPAAADVGNWLPAPMTAPFSLVLRTYLPKDELLTGSYRLPPLLAE